MADVAQFDPNAIAQKDAGIYGLPFTAETAHQVLIPVPWEVTVSYRAGTAGGPKAIYDASAQVDLFDPDVESAWESGLAMDDISPDLEELNRVNREKAEQYIQLLEQGCTPAENPAMATLLRQIEVACETMNDWVQAKAAYFLDRGKLLGLIGGDHSTPLGLIRELGNRYEEFGILHFDAHADLRDAYEGFKYSHASIMFNVLEIPEISRLVQVGIRDYCEDEARLVVGSAGRIHSYYDRDIQERLYDGDSWRQI
jgi:agmatinase